MFIFSVTFDIVRISKADLCLIPVAVSLKKIFKCLLIFEREKERESMIGGGSERERDTESEAGSRL